MRLRLLDIDGSLPVQSGFAEALSEGTAQVVDLRAEEGYLRLWASRRRLDRLRKFLSELGPEPVVTFYGSGDYHHLAALLIEKVSEPITVLHFDNHPDWVRWPRTWNCGGWVSRVLDLPKVSRVVTLGPCSDDLVWPQLKMGNVAALASGRLELYPWSAAPSRVWGRISDGFGHHRQGRHLVWRCLAEENWHSFLDELRTRLPTEAIWISIDKDVLRPQDAATNWDQGQMPLFALLEALRCLSSGKRIVGVDVCGDYSPPRFTDPFKRIEAWRDHPRTCPASIMAAERNDITNRALVATLAEILA